MQGIAYFQVSDKRDDDDKSSNVDKEELAVKVRLDQEWAGDVSNFHVQQQRVDQVAPEQTMKTYILDTHQ